MVAKTNQHLNDTPRPSKCISPSLPCVLFRNEKHQRFEAWRLRQHQILFLKGNIFPCLTFKTFSNFLHSNQTNHVLSEVNTNWTINECFLLISFFLALSFPDLRHYLLIAGFDPTTHTSLIIRQINSPQNDQCIVFPLVTSFQCILGGFFSYSTRLIAVCVTRDNNQRSFSLYDIFAPGKKYAYNCRKIKWCEIDRNYLNWRVSFYQCDQMLE